MSMSSESSGFESNEIETPVDHIIADYLEATERGEMTDLQAYLDRYALTIGEYWHLLSPRMDQMTVGLG